MQALLQAHPNLAYSYYVWELYRSCSYPYFQQPAYPSSYSYGRFGSQPVPAPVLQDYGKQPVVINVEKTAKQNDTFRTVIWTGAHFQVTVMSIPVGSDIGLEVHPNTDQFTRIEEGQGLVQMGKTKDKLDYVVTASVGDAVMTPAGTWHNVTNTGDKPLKVSVVYAPPEHPFGTVHVTKADAEAAE
ncbi:cupin domain-containing protein [Cohnella sp. GCM10020058]|uniref:cupin domain-containing protein n=1 Tax=Cohnella sp. GCM10020058 TaxID=3317330 RepID=UPI0036375B96